MLTSGAATTAAAQEGVQLPESEGRRAYHASEDDSWFDRLLLAFVRRVSGRTIVVVSLALYPGFGLLLPLLLGWPTLWLVDANVFGVFFAALLSLGWLLAQLEAKDRRHLLEWTTDLRHLTAEEFEWFVGEVFRREGWDVTETGRQDAADGNVDLVMTKGKERVIVQCKLWQSWWIGVNDIRAFAGTLRADNKPTTKGLFVTFSDFTEEARKEARRADVELVGRHELFLRAEKARRAEPCPICGKPMLLDRSPRGWWFRCTANGCTGKRDLADQPARAVELLTTRPWNFETGDA